MAEQAIRVSDDRTGDYVATRDAYEQDAESLDRVIQLVDLAYRQVTLNEIRGIGTPIDAADGVDLSSLPSELTDNLIEMGDKRVLIVEALHDANDGEVLVTPVAVNESNEATEDEVELIGTYDTGHKSAYTDDGGSTYNWGSSINTLYTGFLASNYEYRSIGLWEITLPVPVDDITRVVLKLVDALDDAGDNPTNMRLALLDVDDASLPADPDDLFSGLSLKTPVNWDSRYYLDGVTSFINSNGRDSVADITTPFKEVVSRAGFSDGNNVGILFYSAAWEGSATDVQPYAKPGGLSNALIVIEYTALDQNNYSILPTKSTAMGTAKFVDSNGKYVSPLLAWDVYGSKKVGLHVTEINGTSNKVQLRAGVI